MSTETITVRVAPQIAKRLRRLAKATQRSKSFLAAEAIEEYLVVQERQVNAIREGMKSAECGEVTSLEDVKKAWEKRLADSSD